MVHLSILLGIGIVIGLAYLFSNNKKEIPWLTVGISFASQIVLAIIFIATPAWRGIDAFGRGVLWFINHSQEGIAFVFGPLGDRSLGNVFFINSIMPIVFIGAVVGLLTYWRILPRFISLVGKYIARFLRIDTIVAVNGVGNMFVGQSDSIMLTKSYMKEADNSVVFATLVGGLTSISFGLIPLFVSLGAPIHWVIISKPLTVFSAITLLQIVMPTKYNEESINVEIDQEETAIGAMMSGANTGFKTVIGIAIALIVFLSVVPLINSMIGGFFDLFGATIGGNSVSLEGILGLIFRPITFLMGLRGDDLSLGAELIGLRFVTNEVVAYSHANFMALSYEARAVITVALCGFAGIGSVGILLGTYKAIAPEKTDFVAKFGIKALVVATFVNILTAMVVAFFIFMPFLDVA